MIILIRVEEKIIESFVYFFLSHWLIFIFRSPQLIEDSVIHKRSTGMAGKSIF